MALYEIILLGKVDAAYRATVTRKVSEIAAAFGMQLGTDIRLLDTADMDTRDHKSASVALYFGGDPNIDVPAYERLIAARIPIIPVVTASGSFDADIPTRLAGLNGIRLRASDPEMDELISATLECVGLLRKQRRVFVSYRREESRSSALQLHDLLSSKGFDAFLDTHDIRPGEQFQDALWHRLCDSDVVLMLDTRTYFEKKWTLQEIGRAFAKEIHVLRVVFPGHTPNRSLSCTDEVALDASTLLGSDGPIEIAKAEEIVLKVEQMRSRSIAARYLSITGKLEASISLVGKFSGIGAHRAIAIEMFTGMKIWAYPIVGVPTAETLHDIVEKAGRADQVGKPLLVYDHVGISAQWGAHLKWLNDNLAVVRSVKVSEAGFDMAGMVA